ncbi:SpoIID/LytB domain-containing protein [Bacillus sp. FJAT-27445]|uniref:SpoIID/LytB domain-containing protein n=1 Tax=Bacillus sp. FJAT-27445 TaxID=1679166 RepID=UPI0007433343|nr:SpoIID/LytB domain-containing protein [Bacillus sp. FJAT-27445]
MKKLYPFLCLLLLVTAFPQTGEAAEPVQYQNKVDVSIFLASSFPMALNGTYQVVNKDTGKAQVIPPGTTISVKKDTAGVTVAYTGFSGTSAKGFDLQEVSSTKKIAFFTYETDMRRGASTSYDVIHTFQANDTADFLEEITNSQGQVWYRVSAAGKTGWVPFTYINLIDAPSESLTRINNTTTYRGSFFLKPNGSKVEVLNTLGMEDYLKGVVPSEMPASWHKEALKAQAIVARTYATRIRALTNTAASQVYRGYTAEDPRSNAAIKETEGLLVKYDGKVAETYFFSTSGGKTANVGDVWRSNQSYYPYLVSVDDPYETSKYNSWTETFPASTILKSFGYPITATLYDISLSKTGANGEVKAVTIETSAGTMTKTGNEQQIRQLFPLNNPGAYNILYSNWFDITVKRETAAMSVQTSTGTTAIETLKGYTVQTPQGTVTLDGSGVTIQTSGGVVSSEGSGISEITVTGKGWGHRIGMSQYGAKGFAERGYTAEQIVTHYFKGTTVSK